MPPRPPNDRAVISAYRAGERMPPSQRDEAWERLTAAIAEEEGTVRAGPAGWRWLTAGAVLLAAAALLLVLDGLWRSAGQQARGGDEHQAVHDAPAATPEPVRTVRPPAGEAVVEAPAPVDRTPAREQQPRMPAPAPVDEALGAELALLRAARAALANATPEQALRELDEHQRRFPGGLLAQERMVLRVQALCESGATEQARAAAREFTQAYPDSAHVASCDP